MPHPPPEPAATHSPLRPRKSVAFTLLMVDLRALQPGAAGLAGDQRHQDAERPVLELRPVVRRRLRAVPEHLGDPHLRRRHLPALARQHPALRGRSAPAARPCSRRSAGYGLAKFRLPRPPRGLRRRARRGRRAGHGAGRADVPDVQPAGPDEHAVGDHHPVADQPVRPLPDVGVRRRRRPDRDARGGPDRRRGRVPHVLHDLAAGCSPPASSPCCCSPWWRPGTTTSCR